MNYFFSGKAANLKELGYQFHPAEYSRGFYTKGDITFWTSKKMRVDIMHLELDIQKPYIDFIIEHKDEDKEWWLINDETKYVCTSFGRVLDYETYFELKLKHSLLLNDIHDDSKAGLLNDEELKIKFKELRELEGHRDPAFISYNLVLMIKELYEYGLIVK